MDRQAHWQRVYEEKPDDQVSWFQAHPTVSLALIGETGLGPDARILDVGGGASRLVDHLIAQGFRAITILDIAQAALERVRRRLGQRAEGVAWVVADITGWAPPASFDLWHDRAVFHFLTDPADRAAYAAVMAATVPGGGQAIIATFAPDGPERCSGLPVCRYDAQGLAAQFALPFELVNERTEDHRTPAGKIQHFQFVRLRRR